MTRAQAGQSVGRQMTSATDGSEFTGAVTVYVTIDAGAMAIGTVGAGICTHEGHGYHTYRPSAAELDGAVIGFTFVGTGAITRTIEVETVTEVQTAALTAGSLAGAASGRDIVTAALLEMGGIGIDETPDDAIMVFGLSKLNIVLDNWNAERAAVYADAFNTYTLTPSLTPHTIGPTGTFVVTSRPQTIDADPQLLLTSSSPDVGMRITRRDDQWWAEQKVKGLTSAYPTDVYYEHDWPNGKLFFWPVPTTAWDVELKTRVLLAQLTLNTAYAMPPGYKDATILTLAEDLCTPLGKPMPADLAIRASKSRARIFNANGKSRRLITRDAGIPRGGRGLRTFNWLPRGM